MDCRVNGEARLDNGLEVLTPSDWRLPLVLASPHSGRHYPDDFLRTTRLDPRTLRRSEDSYVDEIFGCGPQHGAPLLKALFPRAFLDTNREAFELDPEMFEDALPDYVNTRSPRVAAGLGTIAKVVAHGQNIYRGKLSFSAALDRVTRYYQPYHAALHGIVDEAVGRFGFCILVDCHSMPSNGGGIGGRRPGRKVDFVLGDCYGSACDPIITDTVESWLVDHGYVVARNAPYAGGYTTRHYGRPRVGVHAIQIEINRALYMDERDLKRKPFIATLTEQMGRLIAEIGAIETDRLAPR